MSAKKIDIDFSGVKDQGEFSPRQVPDGDYAAKIVKVEDKESKGDGGFMYVFTIKLLKFSQHSYPYYCKIQENQLWKIRNLLVAAGINVPKTKMKLDPNKAVGKTVGVTMIEDEPYTNDKGKTTIKSVIDAIFPAHELADGIPSEGDNEVPDDGTAFEAGDDTGDIPDEPEVKPKKKKAKDAPADDAPAEGKKKKKKKGKGEENLEELNIDDIG